MLLQNRNHRLQVLIHLGMIGDLLFRHIVQRIHIIIIVDNISMKIIAMVDQQLFMTKRQQKPKHAQMLSTVPAQPRHQPLQRLSHAMAFRRSLARGCQLSSRPQAPLWRQLSPLRTDRRTFYLRKKKSGIITLLHRLITPSYGGQTRL